MWAPTSVPVSALVLRLNYLDQLARRYRKQEHVGKGPDFQDATEGGKHEGMAQANLPEGKVRQLQRTLYTAAKYGGPLCQDS